MFQGDQFSFSNQNEAAKINQSIQAQGTRAVKYTPISFTSNESKDLQEQSGMSISFQPGFCFYSLEELRMIDYRLRQQSGSASSMPGCAIPGRPAFQGFNQMVSHNASAFSNTVSDNQGGSCFGGKENIQGKTLNFLGLSPDITMNYNNSGINNSNTLNTVASYNQSPNLNFQNCLNQSTQSQREQPPFQFGNGTNRNQSFNPLSNNLFTNLPQQSTVIHQSVPMNSNNPPSNAFFNQQQSLSQITNLPLQPPNQFAYPIQPVNSSSISLMTSPTVLNPTSSYPQPGQSSHPQSYPTMNSNCLNSFVGVSLSFANAQPQCSNHNSNKAPADNSLRSSLSLQPKESSTIFAPSPLLNPIVKNTAMLSFESIANQMAQTSQVDPSVHCSSIIQDTTNCTYLNSLDSRMDGILIAFDSQLKQSEQLLRNSIDDKGFNEVNHYYLQCNSYYQTSKRVQPLIEFSQSAYDDNRSEVTLNRQYYQSKGFLKEIEELGDKAYEVIKPIDNKALSLNDLKCPKKDKENNNSDNLLSNNVNSEATSACSAPFTFKAKASNMINQIFTIHISFDIVDPHLRDINRHNALINCLLSKPQSLTVSNDLTVKTLRQLLATHLSSVIPFSIEGSKVIILSPNSTEFKDSQSLHSIGSIRKLRFCLAEDVMNSLSSIEAWEYPKTSQFSLSPSLEEMQTLSRYHLNRIENFSIFNENGRITFPSKTNVLGIEIDSIVTIKPFIVTAYRTKAIPPIGEELNKEAIIEIILSPDEGEDMTQFIQGLKEKVEKLRADYIDYDLSKWTLAFKVLSFNPNSE